MRGSGATTTTTAPENIKAVLLQEARREPVPNTLAISLLKIDKEIGLVRYWGLAEYLRQNQLSFSLASSSNRVSAKQTSTSEADALESSDVESYHTLTEPQASTAKVAFMITSSMKRDLMDGLGYSSEEIKRMTPQQASLVLHHRLAPDLFEENIAILEKNLQEMKQQEQQYPKDEALQAKTDSETDSETDSQATTTAKLNTPNENSNNDTTPESPLLLSSSSPNTSQEQPISQAPGDDGRDATATTPLDESDAENLWYEVVEVQNDGNVEINQIRHGLYKDRDEALLGLETRQDIQSKREREQQERFREGDVPKRIEFLLRSVSAKDLH